MNELSYGGSVLQAARPRRHGDCPKTDYFVMSSVGAVCEPPENRALLEAPLHGRIPPNHSLGTVFCAWPFAWLTKLAELTTAAKLHVLDRRFTQQRNEPHPLATLKRCPRERGRP
jgi:hypothetical protein